MSCQCCRTYFEPLHAAVDHDIIIAADNRFPYGNLISQFFKKESALQGLDLEIMHAKNCPPSTHANLVAIRAMEAKRDGLTRAMQEDREVCEDIMDKRTALALVVALQCPEKSLRKW